MARYSPRVHMEMEALVVDGRDRKKTVFLNNIGLCGVEICEREIVQVAGFEPGDVLKVHIPLQKCGELIINGRVAWNRAERMGVHFHDINRDRLLVIWNCLHGLLAEQNRCPYCGESLDSSIMKCDRCCWNLNFPSKDYFSYWERESLLRRLSSKLSIASVDILQDVLGFLRDAGIALGAPVEFEEMEGFVGSSAPMKNVFFLIRKVAPTDLTVLVCGESGTGKELTAGAIVARSNRKDNPFVVINCAAIPENLLEAELFGYEKGAFTGAGRSKKGKFECAHRGTLFLDEIGELPLSLQPKLLRLLETRKVDRIGARNSVQVDVRIIAATNRNLEQAVLEGRFRSDLYYRLKVFTIELPSLHERGDDKIVLAHHFFKQIKDKGVTCRGFSSEALNAIREYNWPGNVRELLNRIQRAAVIQERWIRPEDLELQAGQLVKNPSTLRLAHTNLRKNMVEAALNEHRYNITQTAKALGVSRPYVYLLMKKLGIQIVRHKGL